MAKAKRTTKEENFETLLAKLEKIVASLEEDQLPLEKALTAFEDGMKLAQACEAQLNSAQQKVQFLLGGELKDLDDL